MSEKTKHVKLDVIIGNPPYQEETKGTRDKQIYPYFMDGSYEVGSKVILITPARFLFNTGNTPTKWNRKMLADNHLKVIKYVANSTKVFKNTDIKGGIVVTYHDNNIKTKPIGFFTPFPELNAIVSKVTNYSSFKPLSDIIFPALSYHFTDVFHEEHPDIKQHMAKGAEYMITTNILDKFPDIFIDKPIDTKNYVGIYGRSHGKRVIKYILSKYIEPFTNLKHYKVFVPQSNGSGALGEVSSTSLIGTPIIGAPLIGHTQTFISIGNFKTKAEAVACFKYIKTKFARVMLGTLKATQHNPASTWRKVPLQDFTSSSDIDWSKSVHEIDLQLYKKYNLSQNEINFIEKHVKTMD